MTKSIYDYKLGEIVNKDSLGVLNNVFDGEVTLVKITYTLQDKNGVTMDASLKHKCYIEEDEEVGEKLKGENNG